MMATRRIAIASVYNMKLSIEVRPHRLCSVPTTCSSLLETPDLVAGINPLIPGAGSGQRPGSNLGLVSLFVRRVWFEKPPRSLHSSSSAVSFNIVSSQDMCELCFCVYQPENKLINVSTIFQSLNPLWHTFVPQDGIKYTLPHFGMDTWKANNDSK